MRVEKLANAVALTALARPGEHRRHDLGQYRAFAEQAAKERPTPVSKIAIRFERFLRARARPRSLTHQRSP